MKQIELSQGKFALVDDEDFEELNKYKWSAKEGKHTFYAMRKEKNGGKSILMHRQIMGLQDRHALCDHEDHNGLNNQKRNLRIASHSQNCINRNIYNNNRSSNYLGVSFFKSTNKWRAEIRSNGEYRYLGLFVSEHEAALAYNKAAMELHREFASLNKVA